MFKAKAIYIGLVCAVSSISLSALMVETVSSKESWAYAERTYTYMEGQPKPSITTEGPAGWAGGLFLKPDEDSGSGWVLSMVSWDPAERAVIKKGLSTIDGCVLFDLWEDEFVDRDGEDGWLVFQVSTTELAPGLTETVHYMRKRLK